ARDRSRSGCGRARGRRPTRCAATGGRDQPSLRRAAPAGAGGDRVRRLWPPLLLLAAAVGLWELVVRAANVPDYLFPAPTAVASSLANDRGLLSRATLVTVREIVLGYLLAVTCALAIAVVLHFSTALRRALL